MISQHPLRCWIVVGRHSTYGNINRSVGGHLMLHTVVSQDSHEALESEKFLEDEALSLGARLYHERQDRKAARSEEHTSELQSLMRISYAVFCLKKKKTK